MTFVDILHAYLIACVPAGFFIAACMGIGSRSDEWNHEPTGMLSV